jgi:hypothetical protein
VRNTLVSELGSPNLAQLVLQQTHNILGRKNLYQVPHKYDHRAHAPMPTNSIQDASTITSTPQKLNDAISSIHCRMPRILSVSATCTPQYF